MSVNRYITNLLTGRTIRIGKAKQSYLNIETRHIVQFKARTYFHLVQKAGYELIKDYYLVPSRYVKIAQHTLSLLYLQDTQAKLENLNTVLNRINFNAEWN
ncbi:hypothetical protein RCL_jg25470.t1 [Rhizophagus clarus]|uniref:Uncharacterized protein n=1 Tax=Rhizophagus clarus TaxID=94130 RepID=A0A8H3LFE9_9GLOM|nr:hypothetical protein RCL_jg25470.t1 [Rhizophagus clarus]